jgi:hypothetical protein
VWIPEDALEGDWEMVRIKAVSSVNPEVQDTCSIKTTAVMQLVAGFTFAPEEPVEGEEVHFTNTTPAPSPSSTNGTLAMDRHRRESNPRL